MFNKLQFAKIFQFIYPKKLNNLAQKHKKFINN